jgi:hypothetical protein
MMKPKRTPRPRTPKRGTGKAVWVTRHMPPVWRMTVLWALKPTLGRDGLYRGRGPRGAAQLSFTSRSLHAMTGLTLKPGECRRVRFGWEEVK